MKRTIIKRKRSYYRRVKGRRKRVKPHKQRYKKTFRSIFDWEGKKVVVDGKLATILEVRSSSKIGIEFEDTGKKKWVDIIDIIPANEPAFRSYGGKWNHIPKPVYPKLRVKQQQEDFLGKEIEKQKRKIEDREVESLIKASEKLEDLKRQYRETVADRQDLEKMWGIKAKDLR